MSRPIALNASPSATHGGGVDSRSWSPGHAGADVDGCGHLVRGVLQTGQIERRLERMQITHSPRLRDVWQQALEGLLAGQAETPERFVGTERDLRGLAPCPSAPSELGPEWLSPSLRDSSNSRDRTRLCKPGPLNPPTLQASRPLVLGQWSQGKLQWRYLDDAGQWRDNWPPVMERPRGLPRAIALLHDDAVVVLASPASPGESLGRRQDGTSAMTRAEHSQRRCEQATMLLFVTLSLVVIAFVGHTLCVAAGRAPRPRRRMQAFAQAKAQAISADPGALLARYAATRPVLARAFGRAALVLMDAPHFRKVCASGCRTSAVCFRSTPSIATTGALPVLAAGATQEQAAGYMDVLEDYVDADSLRPAQRRRSLGLPNAKPTAAA